MSISIQIEAADAAQLHAQLVGLAGPLLVNHQVQTAVRKAQQLQGQQGQQANPAPTGAAAEQPQVEMPKDEFPGEQPLEPTEVIPPPKNKRAKKPPATDAEKAAATTVETTETPAPKKIEQADVRAALIAHMKDHNEADTQKLLKDAGGVDKLSQLPPEKYQDVLDAIEKAKK